ncbi:MAG: M48 family metallopeptidase [Longimicrobiales bacterium]|nr:M48 family metallopeptidase [Longimicrobiales bacterium]
MDQQQNSPGTGGDGARARRILTGIAPRSWEHPADKAALAALRKLPIFDEVLRRLFGFFGEKPVRLAFQANAVKVGPDQFPEIFALYRDVLRTLDVETEYDLFVSQTPIVNAGAYGMDRPFIILNSGMLLVLEPDEIKYILGHELGHILSGHVLYRTMTVLLIQLAGMGFPIVGIAARAILVGLLEWQRKAEFSCDRAGLLAVQQPEVVMRGLMKLAGGGELKYDMNLEAFIKQAEDYRDSGDVADQVFKVLNLLGATHPFPVLRVSEIRVWIESGAYDRILRGEYARRGEPDPAYQNDLREAAQAYAEGARDFMGSVQDAAKRMGESIFGGLRR